MSDPLAALVAAAGEAVARHFDEEAFACDFGGQTAINLPNLDVVIPLAAIPPGAVPVTEEELAAALIALSEPDWLGRVAVSIQGDSGLAAAAILAALRAAR